MKWTKVLAMEQLKFSSDIEFRTENLNLSYPQELEYSHLKFIVEQMGQNSSLRASLKKVLIRKSGISEGQVKGLFQKNGFNIEHIEC